MSTSQAISRSQLKQNGKELVLDKDKPIQRLLLDRGYECVCKLASTLLGSVWRATPTNKDENTNQKDVIIKVSSKQSISRSQCHENAKQEIEILKLIRNQYAKHHKVAQQIIGYLDSFEDDEYCYLVLEDGGIDLFEFVKQCHKDLESKLMSVQDWLLIVKELTRRILDLTHFLHETLRVCHLDLSLENVLISNLKWTHYIDDDGVQRKKLDTCFVIHLCDFGACKQFEAKKQEQDEEDDRIDFECRHFVGKTRYSSPTLFARREAFDARSADVWSIGVCVFVMVFGNFPWMFPSENDALFKSMVMERRMLQMLRYWKKDHLIDRDAQIVHLLSNIFVVCENQRFSVQQIKQHPWLS